MLQRPASILFLSSFFVQLPFVTWRKGCQSHIFFFQATSSFVKQQDQQKNPFTLNTEERNLLLEEGKNYFGYNEIVPSPQRLKRRPQMHLRCVSLMKDLIFSKKNLSHFYGMAFWTSSGSDEIEHSKDEGKDHTNTLETLRCVFKSWKKSLSTLGTKHSWKLISCGNFFTWNIVFISVYVKKIWFVLESSR